MYEINNGVVYVKGAKKGAIYDFISENVYWVSSEACSLIDKLIILNGEDASFTKEEREYIALLESKRLYRRETKIKKYNPYINNINKLEMAWLEITQACNCKCLHCYQGDQHKSVVNTLTCGEWIRIISELKAEGVSRVVVIGGEPCIHKDICDIVLELCKQDIDTTLFTNATIISPRLIDLITYYSNKVSVKVSLYADNAIDHDLITQCPGSFDKLVKNIRTLVTNGVRVDIAVVAMRENQDKLSHIKDFVHSLGANYSKFDVIRNVFGGTQDQHTPTNQEIIDSCLFCRPHFRASKQRFDNNCYRNSCWFGKIAITETGDILPCVFERNISYGNVRESSINDILQSKRLNDYWHMDFNFIEYCKDCEFRYSCKDCRPLGISVKGSITSQNPRCKYNPYTGEWK